MLSLATRTEPDVTTRLRIAADSAAAVRQAADLIARAVTDAHRPFHLSLAGGSTPSGVYRRLATSSLDWRGVHLWMGDERAVAPSDPDANARLIVESLLVPGGPDGDQLELPDWSLGPDGAVADYAERMRAAMATTPTGLPILDFAFLGLGEDGHTASLFPGHPALDAQGVCALVTDSPKPPPVRLSLTLPVLAAARARLVLATGPGKAGAVAAMLATPDRNTPASLLPRQGTTLVIDASAAARISGAHDG